VGGRRRPPHHYSAGSDVMLDVLDVMSRLGEVENKTAEALRATERDGSARDAVIDLEQAGDRAKAAVEADPSLGRKAYQEVQDAHLAICILKTEV
jgi:hypothetical protein